MRFLRMKPPVCVVSIAYICYTMPRLSSSPEYRSIAPPGWEAAHALESLVVSGVRFAVRLRPDPNLPVDGALPGGNEHSQGSARRHQYRARPGFGARLL